MKPVLAASRDRALDFTRGALVLCMVVYHAVNYSGADPAVLRHLRFLPGAFVFLAGFGVGRLYLPRWEAGEKDVPLRLCWRGVRILALFLALNVLAHVLMPASYNRQLDLAEFAERLDVILGPGGVRAAVFGVLPPIAYVLAACGAALALGRKGRGAVRLLGTSVSGGAAVLAIFSPLPFNLELAALGFLGVLAGSVNTGWLPLWLRQPLPLLVVFFALQAPLLRDEPGFGLTAALITVTLALLYTTGRRISSRLAAVTPLLLMGRNSLPAYLLQIAALQLLFRTMRAMGIGPPDLISAIVFTATVTLAGIAATTTLRIRSPLADRTYRALFA
jgi:hypothetical protein